MTGNDATFTTPYEVVLDPNGSGTAYLGRDPITVDEGDVDATRRALIELCIEHAREIGGRILVRVRDIDNEESMVEIDPEGTSRQVSSIANETAPSASVFAPRDRKTFLAGIPTRAPRPLVVVLVVSAVVVLLAILATLNLLLGGTTPPDAVQVTSGEKLPQAPPLEWQAESAWSSPPLLPEAQKVAVVDGTAIGLVTAERRVALVGDDGQTRWTQALPEGEVRSPLTLTMIGETRVLAIHVGDQLVWWAVNDGQGGSVSLPSQDAPITWRGDTPLIGTGQQTVAIVRGGALTQIAVPKGARAVSAWADGHVVAASATSWWRLAPNQEPGPGAPWETPAATADQLTVIDAMGPYIVTAQAVAKGVQVVIHQDTPQGVVRLMAGGLPGVKPGEALTWRPSSSRTWGVLGHAIVDMEKTSVTDLGKPLSVQHVIADRGLGTLGQQQVVFSPDAPTGVLQPGESFPEEVLGRNAIVRAAAPDTTQRIYVLPPNPATSSSTRR